MKISKVILPSNSILYNTDFDFVDSYRGKYIDQNDEITAQDIGKAFFKSSPKWFEKLFEIRNGIVSVLGLKTSGKTKSKKESIDKFTCEPNERLGLFKVFYKTEHEVILGEDDKHLDFRISLLKTNDLENKGSNFLTISTTVQFNNWFGKLYFLPVKPFHKLIVPIMLKGIIKEIESDIDNLQEQKSNR